MNKCTHEFTKFQQCGPNRIYTCVLCEMDIDEQSYDRIKELEAENERQRLEIMGLEADNEKYLDYRDQAADRINNFDPIREAAQAAVDARDSQIFHSDGITPRRVDDAIDNIKAALEKADAK